MNIRKHRLVGLNLALLMLLTSALPASAAAGDTVVSEEAYSTSTVLVQEYKTSDGSEDEEVYEICVNGYTFLSNQDANGTGWEYDGAGGRLALRDYVGGPILAYGDLSIVTSGDVSITGGSDEGEGEQAIDVYGELSLMTFSGTLAITGGDGEESAGYAVWADSVSLICRNDETVITAGDALSDSAEVGGHAICAAEVELSGENLTIVGGNNVYGTAGCGIYASDIDIEADCFIQGGAGVNVAPAIYYFYTCQLGLIDADFIGGGEFVFPILCKSYADACTRHKHTNVSQPAYNQISVRINQYNLTIHGNEGETETGATFTSLRAYYPTHYKLSDYLIFEREGHIQVGWNEGSQTGTWYPLNKYYTPTSSIGIYANWIEVQDGDIVLNGLSGTFEDGSYYKKYNDVSVTLPEQMRYGNSSISLMAWGTEVDQYADEELYIYDGLWYLGGDVVEPDSDDVKGLYAKSNAGAYAIYHPTLGTVSDGGSILLQGTVATATSLKTYALDEDLLTAPKGYSFAGWSETEGGEVEYTAGQDLMIPAGGGVIHLYAVWEQVEFDHSPADGVTITDIPNEKVVQLNVSRQWCEDKGARQVLFALYDPDSGQLLDFKIEQYQSEEDISIELNYTSELMPNCRVFSLDEFFKPVAEMLTCRKVDLT